MKFYSAVLTAKGIQFLTTNLRIGGGSAAPGHYALKIDPNLVKRLATQIPYHIVVTGTNGKTTTARVLAHFLESQNKKLIRNATGSNLERGVASTLLKVTNPQGQIKNIEIGIWELDEAASNKVIPLLKPHQIIFLNALRDQLDRYGEVDTVVSRWQKTISQIDWPCQLIINASDPSLAPLIQSGGNQVITFQVPNYELLWEKPTSRRPKTAQYSAKITKNRGLSGFDFEITHDHQIEKLSLDIPGIYHVFDVTAAYIAYHQMNLPLKEVRKSLETFQPAFGRVEKTIVYSTDVLTMLIKNPAGATLVFETIAPELTANDTLLVVLNDNFADGTDVSWIWDAQFEKLFEKQSVRHSGLSRIKKTVKILKQPYQAARQVQDENHSTKNDLPTIILSGKRAFDLGLRLKYAGIPEEKITIEPDIDATLTKSLETNPGRLFILPTYTALLHLQRLFAQKGYKQHYWKES